MLKRTIALAVLGGLIALPACTSNQSAVEPPKTVANVSTSKLQFQVGTANYSGTTFLNTVVTFRQPNGLSALLDNTPSISLPFTNTAVNSVPSSGSVIIYAGNDSGKAQISGTVQTNNGVVSADPRTFPQTVGAFAYGFIAANVTTTGGDVTAFYSSAAGVSLNPNQTLHVGQQAWRMPIYGASLTPAVTQRAFYVGPGSPMVPDFNDGSLGLAFNGYPSGFTTFGITPTLGTYALNVGLPNASSPIPTFTSTTSMTSLATLGAMPTPVYTSDGLGGGTVTVTVPAGVTETAVFIRDLAPSGATIFYYTLITHGTGPQTLTLADNLGPASQGPPIAGSTPGGTGHPSAVPGDAISLVAIGFDYPAMEAVPIGAGPPQTPAINNTGTACSFTGATSSTCTGQADLTVSGAGAATE